MIVKNNTLELIWETWDDPGDYPNSVASSPLPSYKYPVLEGQIVFQAENQEEIDSFDCISDWILDYIDLNVKSVTWKSKVTDNICLVWAEECDADCPEPECPSYDDWNDWGV